MKKHLLAALLAALSLAAAAQEQVNIICSVQAEWCNLMSTVYSRTTGAKVNMTAKGSGEALAQLNAERANPKIDIWFGGTGDPHLQAAEQGLTLEHKEIKLIKYDYAKYGASAERRRLIARWEKEVLNQAR